MVTAHDPMSAIDVDEGTTKVENSINPFETLQSIALGYSESRCLHLIANLGVADHLGSEEQRSAADLAA